MNTTTMKSPSNHYIIAFPKERKVGSLYLPTHLGEEEGLFAPEVGRVVGLPMKFTNRMAIPCSAFGETMTVKDIEDSFKNISLNDEVFCNYLATCGNHIMDEGDEALYAVPAHLLIAIIKDKQLVPTADKVIIIPKDKEASKLLHVNMGKDHGIGTVDFDTPLYRKGEVVIYMEKFAYEFTYATDSHNNTKYDCVYSVEVLAKI